MTSFNKQLPLPSFFTPDIENENMGSLLKIILWVLLTSTLVILAVTALIAPNIAEFNLKFGIVLTLTLGSLLMLVKSGRIRLSGFLLALTIWLLLSIELYLYSGFRNLSVTGFFLVLLVAGLFLDVKAVIGFTGLILVSIMGLFSAEQNGIIIFSISPEARTIDLVTLAAMIILGAALIAVINIHNKSAQAGEQTAIKQAEERYQSLFEEAPVMYVMTEPQDGVPIILDCNKLFLSTLGYSRHEVIRHPLEKFYTPESKPQLEEGFQQALAGRFLPQERALLTTDGQKIHTLLRAVPIKLPNNQTLTGTLAMYVDITEQKNSEERLQNAKEILETKNAHMNTLYRMGQIINSTLESDEIMDRLTDEAMRVTRATHGQVLVVRAEKGFFERRSLRGFSKEETELAEATDLPLHGGINGRVYATGETILIKDVQAEPDYFSLIPATRTEVVVPIMRDGQVLGNLDLQSSAAGAFDDVDLGYLNTLAGQVAIALTNARAFHSVEQARLEWETTFDAIRDAIVLVDLQSRVVQANQSFLDIVSNSFGEVQWNAFDELLSKTACLEPSCSLAPLPANFEQVRCNHQVGSRIFNIQLFPIKGSRAGSANDSARLICVMHDITQDRQAEDELKRYAGKLEQSNRELQDFAYVASHDMQEPLRKVQAFGDRLRARYGEALDDRGIDYLERMQSAAARMQNLINALLTYSRVSTQAQPFTSIDLNQVMQDVIIDLEVQIDRVGGRVEVENLPTLDADAMQMHQLFQNLISNALKFHREEEPVVVRVSHQLMSHNESVGIDPSGNGQGNYCQLLVEDNGIGFDEKYADRIFQVFQRLHGRTQYAGTGVGLAICRKIVDRHNGQITAISAPGHGTTFKVILPIEQRFGDFE